MSAVSQGGPAPGAWTFRQWLLPWLQVACATGFAAATGTLVPLLACLSILVAIPFRQRPVAHRRWVGWFVVFACSLWWMAAAIAKQGNGGFAELLRIGGWCLVLLASLQVLSLGAGGSTLLAGWSALGASLVFAGMAGKPGLVLIGVQVVLLVESVRRTSSPSVGDAPSALPVPVLWRWALVLLVAVGVSGVVQKRWMGSWKSSGARWTESVKRIKGFSTVTRLGSFGPGYIAQRDGEVALRVFADASPGRLKGMVQDVYSNGNWIALRHSETKSAERMKMDFSQFCREASDTAPVRAWARSPDDRLPVLFAPSGTGCVGVVADSLVVRASGVFRAPLEGVSRGWTWYGTQAVDTSTAPSDLRVPKELNGLLDSVLAQIGWVAGADSMNATGSTKAVDAVAAYLARDFRYDLNVPLVVQEDPLRTFMRVKRGYCEYYASAGVLLLRRAGVAARYATGFSEPERSGAGSWIYRQASAHAWVEWKPNGGNWRIFDPTPASTQAPKSLSRIAVLTESVGGWADLMVHRLRDGRWREQLDDRFGSVEDMPWERWGLVAIALGVAFIGLIVLRRRRVVIDHPQRAWVARLENAEDLLRREGYARSASETVGAFLARLPMEAHPRARAELRSYQAIRWSAKSES